MSVDAVVFDVGGVLVDWRPHLAWAPELGEEGALAFLERSDFTARNARADAGARFSDLAAEIDDPEDASRLAAYPALYGRTVRAEVPGTWEIVRALKARGTPVHAITNWSAETWAAGVAAHPRLGDAFGTVVISGREGIAKPDARIFGRLCERAGIAPGRCLFVDDAAPNVEGARAAGMAGHHFRGADALRADLTGRGLL